MRLEINFSHIYYFYMVVEHQGVRNAASVLCVSAPAVSAQIKKLEHLIGFKLFARKQGALELTEKASKFYPEVKKLIKQGEYLENTIKRIQASDLDIVLRIGVHSIPLLSIVPHLMASLKHAEHFFKVKFVPSRSMGDLLNMLADGVIDICFSDLLIEKKELIFEKALESSVCFAVCPTSTLYNETSISLYDLEYMPILLPSEGSGFARLVEDHLKNKDVNFKNSEKYAVPINRDLIPHTDYGSFFPTFLIKNKEIDKKKFRTIDILETFPNYVIYTVYRKSDAENKVIQDFLNFLAEHGVYSHGIEQ